MRALFQGTSSDVRNVAVFFIRRHQGTGISVPTVVQVGSGKRRQKGRGQNQEPGNKKVLRFSSSTVQIYLSSAWRSLVGLALDDKGSLDDVF